jgi:hypothetical protein
MRILFFICFLLVVQACSKGQHGQYKKIEPAKVMKEGNGIPKISLTEKAYERLGIKSVRIPASRSVEINNSALIFDNYGKIWVFVQEANLSFHREEVTLHKVHHDLASVSFINLKEHSVVISGSAELYGTESGVGK